LTLVDVRTMGRFSGKRVPITGGTSGIGLVGAKRIVDEGGEVAVTGTTGSASTKPRARFTGRQYAVDGGLTARRRRKAVPDRLQPRRHAQNMRFGGGLADA
jgi:NAD(P)-dependent dehydrogenase (short-subunit alcohol dehydrogenase family)